MKIDSKNQGEIKTRALWGVAGLTLVGAGLLWEGKPWFFIPWIFALYFLCGIFIYQKILSPIDKIVQGLSFGILWILSRGMLVFIYYLIITPVGLWFRITGRDPLCLKKRDKQESYWKKRPVEQQRSDCEKQY